MSLFQVGSEAMKILKKFSISTGTDCNVINQTNNNSTHNTLFNY